MATDPGISPKDAARRGEFIFDIYLVPENFFACGGPLAAWRRFQRFTLSTLSTSLFSPFKLFFSFFLFFLSFFLFSSLFFFFLFLFFPSSVLSSFCFCLWVARQGPSQMRFYLYCFLLHLRVADFFAKSLPPIRAPRPQLERRGHGARYVGPSFFCDRIPNRPFPVLLLGQKVSKNLENSTAVRRMRLGGHLEFQTEVVCKPHSGRPCGFWKSVFRHFFSAFHENVLEFDPHFSQKNANFRSSIWSIRTQKCRSRSQHSRENTLPENAVRCSTDLGRSVPLSTHRSRKST